MKNRKNENGFTLVEVLVTSFIFSIIALSVNTIFVQIINLQRRGFAIQKIQDNSFLVLEEMSRDIRVSRISDQESSDCTATSISLMHPTKGSVTYLVSGGIVIRTAGGGTFYESISSSNVNFTKMNFCILGSLTNDNQSPRVSIITSVQNRTGKDILQINIQTTTTSRNVVDEFQNP